MGIAIETLELGPAKYVVGTVPIASKSGGTMQIDYADYTVEGELSGIVHRRNLHLKTAITFTPDDQVNSGILGKLFAMRQLPIGASLFGAAAVPLTVKTMDAKKFGLLDVAATNMPDINFAVNKGLFGSITFVGRPSRGKVPGAAASLVAATGAESPWVAPTFVATEFMVGTPVLVWDTDVIDSESDDGWTVSFNVKTQEVMGANRLRDIRFMGIEIMVRGTPSDATAAELEALLPMTTDVVTSGDSNRNAGVARPLSLTMGGLTFGLADAYPVSAGYRFGAQTLRVGEVGFVGINDFSGDWFTLA